MKAKYLKQLKEMGEAQKATGVKNEAVDALKDWMSDFISVSRIALEDSPQELEILGIVVKL